MPEKCAQHGRSPVFLQKNHIETASALTGRAEDKIPRLGGWGPPHTLNIFLCGATGLFLKKFLFLEKVRR